MRFELDGVRKTSLLVAHNQILVQLLKALRWDIQKRPFLYYTFERDRYCVVDREREQSESFVVLFLCTLSRAFSPLSGFAAVFIKVCVR